MTQNSNCRQSGFTLVEMAVVILILGLIVGSVFGYLSIQRQEQQQQITLQRGQKIVSALADYAQRTGLLPCPGLPNPNGGDPFGVDLGLPLLYNAATNPNGVCATPTQRNGIVPFRVLGLTRDDILDGYANPFTYAVAAQATIPLATAVLVHEQCRNLNWIPLLAVNLNRAKARLCCPLDPALRLRVYNNSTNLTTANQVTPEPTATAGSLGLVDARPLLFPEIGRSLAYDALVLISHGKNASNTYTLGQTARRNSAGADFRVNVGNGEAENSDADDDYVAIPRSESNTNAYFDDIVFTRTQQSLLREFSNDSCAVP